MIFLKRTITALSHCLSNIPNDLVFNGLVENRKKPGAGGGGEKGISHAVYQETCREKQHLRITAAGFIPEINYSVNPLPTLCLTVKLKTWATLSTEGQSWDRTPFTLTEWAQEFCQQEDLKKRGTLQPGNRRRIFAWSTAVHLSLLTSTGHLAVLVRHTKCWQQELPWPKRDKVSFTLWGWEIHLCYLILMPQFFQ